MVTLGPLDARFKHPCNISVVGPSQAGKSTWVRDLLLHEDELFDVEFEQIHWIYAQDTDLTRILPYLFPKKIKLWKGLPLDFDQFLKDIPENSVIVIDDLQQDVSKHPDIVELFTRQGHHLKITVILMLHNLFFASKNRVTINRNSSYIAMFKSPLDLTPISAIGQKLLHKKSNIVVEIYLKACEDPHSCLLIDGTQDCPDVCRLRSHIFEGYQRVYIPMPWLHAAKLEML